MSLEIGGFTGALQFFIVLIVAYYLAGGGVTNVYHGRHTESRDNEYPGQHRRG